MNKNQEIIDNLKVVCQCRGIKKGTFKKLIADGADTMEKLQKATGAGGGECTGTRCEPRLEELLEQFADKKETQSG